MTQPPRASRAGESLEDYCRACKTDRLHTIIVTDQHGAPLRVSCGYCHSEHNYRGGPRIDATPAAAARPRANPAERPQDPALPLVTERERISPAMSADAADLELLLRRVIREETGLTPVAPAQKWRGGMLALRPGTSGLQEKTWPIETFFHKIVMLRNRLRTLEQVVNASTLSDDEKVRIQGYISGCYGSLTSFNVLFAEEADMFKGAASE
jgi:hypothetical protein